jgi:ribosomal protein L4
MAKIRSSPKTDLVLEYLATNPAATTSQVVTDLKAHGISESLVAKVRQGRRDKRGPKAKAKAAATPAASSNGAVSSLSIDDLVAAKKLVAQVGSIEKVKEALAALARLG